jgi:hypothetical protein
MGTTNGRADSGTTGVQTRKDRPLAEVFYTVIGSRAELPGLNLVPVKVTIRCQYCGFEDTADCIETAGAEFFEHMYFGSDTSAAHFEYAAGSRNRVRSAK